MSTPTQITIRPDRELDIVKYPVSSKRLAGDRHQFGPTGTTANAQFFGEDGPGVMDVVDAVNPLCHIPFVSSLYEEMTGTKVSAASKLVGGALLGGPLGFVAALGNVIFENETGHTMGGAVVAAIRGEEPAQQLAAAPEPAQEEEVAALSLGEAEQALAETKAQRATLAGQEAVSEALAGIGSVSVSDAAPSSADAATLALFGGQDASAHASYRKAQFRPYLTDVSTSLVL